MLTSSIHFALDRSERRLWTGAPRRGLVVRASDLTLIPFSLLWAGFVSFGMASAIRDGNGFLQIWLTPFVLVGLYITIGRFFADAAFRARTTYAVTSERVIIEVAPLGPVGRKTISLRLDRVAEITLEDFRDGMGTITFDSTGLRVSRSRRETAPEFEFIPNARLVYDLIRDAQRGASER